MSDPSEADNNELLEAKIIERPRRIAEPHEVPPRGSDASGVFSNLTWGVLKSRSPKVVLLVGEYDAPAIKILQTPVSSKIKDLLIDTRAVKPDFYGKVKSADKCLESVFIAAVTKFSRMNVFSVLNNVTDISLLP
jgi:hypothetical protein